MELTIINYTNKFNSNKIKLECKYYNYTYYLSEKPREKITDDNYYIFTKISNKDKKMINTNDDNINLPSYIRKYRSSKICKRLFYYINYINKLDDGKIKEYQIFNMFELDVLCNYLINKNIVYEIVVKDYRNIFMMEKIKKFTYDSYEYQISIKEYIQWVNDPEANKIYKSYKIYVRVYKGFVDLIKNKTKAKYMVYIWE